MNNKLFTNIFIGIVTLYFAVFFGVMTYRYLYSPYKTETAFLHTIADSYQADAVAIRDERTISQRKNQDEYISYIKDDGEVVVSGSVVARIFSNPEQLVYRSQIEHYQTEIELLKRAQQSSEQFLAADSLLNQVDNTVGEIVEAVVSRDLDTLHQKRDRLQLMLGRYRVSMGKDKDYSDRIKKLEQIVASISEKLNEEHFDVSVEEGGYFCSVVDGYETMLTTNFDNVTAEELKRIINKNTKPKEADRAGKVQVGHDWYLALEVENSVIEKFSEGAMVWIDLRVEGGENIPASVNRVIPDEKSSIVILKLNYVTSELIALRHTEVDVKFKSYTGLKIPVSALRYNGLDEGVYVKTANIITFKSIVRLYTGEDFILCCTADNLPLETELKYPLLSQFDEVVVKGTDLYDGKVI